MSCMTSRMTSLRPALALAVLVAIVAACGGASDEGVASNGTSPAPAGATTRSAEGKSFPTGPAVLVANGYQAPKDKVDTTGAFLPANGKPTIVWVDAIW